MQAVKRIEIIIDARELREVCRTLEALGVTGYSVIRDVTGRGDRGVQSGDELTDVFKNSLLLTAASPAQLPGIIDAVRPILKRRGGICLVSDAQWVIH
jgi:nitrogen regulatory protein PII